LGANIRLAGEDLKSGQTVLACGHIIKPADLGLLASLGVPNVNVYRRLKVAFFSTGDELVGVGKPLAEGQIYDSNRYTLYGMLQRLGVEISDLGAIPDNPQLLEQALLTAAAEHDAVITSGGVSVGEADHMKALLAKHGEVLFWKINNETWPTTRIRQDSHRQSQRALLWPTRQSCGHHGDVLSVCA